MSLYVAPALPGAPLHSFTAGEQQPNAYPVTASVLSALHNPLSTSRQSYEGESIIVPIYR